MTFNAKLKKKQYKEIWEEYCGFLDMDIQAYMQMQHRLMDEQLKIWMNSGLGQQLLANKRIDSVEAFRREMPFTQYEDYADYLLQKRDDLLPAPAVLWIQTTWEGGCNPIKRAPYTKGMLDAFSHNLLAAFVLSRTTEKGVFHMSSFETVLHGFAPMPYLTGLIPLVMSDETSLELVPSAKVAESLSFSEKNKLGFKLGLSSGIDYFFSMGSVAYHISKSIGAMSSKKSGKSSGSKLPIRVILKVLRANARCKKENRELLPKDLYNLKSFICAGTDNARYKDALEQMWGVRPLEIFMGTEPTCLGTETWNRDGMYFFPDACFYEFIPESEMLKSFADEAYIPKSYLMDQVIVGEKYELVITNFKGGAFARYRVGDVYRCAGLSSVHDDTKIPRFEFIDRIPTVIDIAGFTRITEKSIQRAIDLSQLSIVDWFAAKEFNEEGHPYLHFYAEISKDSIASHAISAQVVKDHLTIYFKYIDHDYEDLKKILGMDPLLVTIVRCGTFRNFTLKTGATMQRINPPSYDISAFLNSQNTQYAYDLRAEVSHG